MTNLEFNPLLSETNLRRAIFDGRLLLYPSTSSSLELCNHAIALMGKAFHGLDAELAQHNMIVEDYVATIAPLKSEFTNSQKTKLLLQEFLEHMGCDLELTYFDVPKIRVVTDNDYLTAGVGYAYKPHRDTWYAGPFSQINWWVPIYSVVPENSMSIYPSYWERAVSNTSCKFDYEKWCLYDRPAAINNIHKDTRNHPISEETIDVSEEIRISCNQGEILMFSAAQIHATNRNTSGKTRFSYDFRTVNLEDLRNSVGAKNVDSACTGTTLGDFFRASDLRPFPTEEL